MNNNIIVFLIISFILFFIFNTENIYNKKNKPIENFTTSNNRIVNEEEDTNKDSNQDNNEAEVYMGTKDCSSQIILIDSLWENARDMLINTNDSLFSKSEKKFLNENKNINLINIKNIFKKI